MRKKIKISLIVISFISCLSVYFARPNFYSFNLLRVEHLDLYCGENICVEDQNDFLALNLLFQETIDSIKAKGLDNANLPYFVFCKSQTCYSQFGGRSEIAISFPWLGTVVSLEGWNKTIIKHELIHWVQFENFGPVTTMLMPEWFREGMAYSLSGAYNNQIPSHYREGVKMYKEMFSSK